jgi:hypothetical protein
VTATRGEYDAHDEDAIDDKLSVLTSSVKKTANDKLNAAC